MKRIPLLLLAAACVASCSSTPPQQMAAADTMVCTRETPIGTSIPVTKCRTQEQIDKERQAAREVKDSVRTLPGRDEAGR